MTNIDVYNKFMENGLFQEVDHNEFSKGRCDNCNGLPGERYSVEGFLSIEESKDPGNMHRIEVCINCFEKLGE